MKFKSHNKIETDFMFEYTQYPVSALIAKRAIPLDPGMMDRLGYLQRDFEAYSVMNHRDIRNTVKIQNTKKHISSFSRGGPELARLPSQPDVLLKLIGTAVIEGNTDVWTTVSTRDRRWLDQDGRIPGSKITFGINGVLQKIANNLGIEVDLYKMKPDQLQKEIEKLDKSTQIKLYREYLTGVERYLDQGGYKDLNDYLKKAATLKYNEIILTNFRITEGFCIGVESPATVAIFDDNNIPYSGVISRKDLGSLKI